MPGVRSLALIAVLVAVSGRAAAQAQTGDVFRLNSPLAGSAAESHRDEASKALGALSNVDPLGTSGPLQQSDPFSKPASGSQPAVATTGIRTVARPTSAPTEGERGGERGLETAPTTRRKTWKDFARTHNEGKTAETHSTTLSPWTAIGALAGVICLILVLARVFRRHAPLFSQNLPTEALEVLGRRFVDQRQAILLVRIGSRILVVGSSTAGLQSLGELSDPVEVDVVAGMCRGNKASAGLSSSFLGMLTGHVGPKAGTARPESKSRTNAARPTERASRTQSQRSMDDVSPSRRPVAINPADQAGSTDQGRAADQFEPRLQPPEAELMRRLRGSSALSHADAEAYRD